jgi:hypothetical protein
MVVNMTKAKRYEGERLRAEQWHNMGRDKAWEKKRAGMRELEPIVHNKFDLYCETKFDPVECGYLIVTEVTVAKPPLAWGGRSHTADEIILVHVEPCIEFPSDHLKTKLILLAG